MSSTRERIREIMASVFALPISQIPEDAAMDTVAGWDSLAHLELMLAIEMEFSLKLSAESIMDLGSLAEIEELVTASTAGI